MSKEWAILWAIQGMTVMYIYSLPFSVDDWWNIIVQALLIVFIIFDAIATYLNLNEV